MKTLKLYYNESETSVGPCVDFIDFEDKDINQQMFNSLTMTDGDALFLRVKNFIYNISKVIKIELIDHEESQKKDNSKEEKSSDENVQF